MADLLLLVASVALVVSPIIVMKLVPGLIQSRSPEHAHHSTKLFI